MSVERDFQNSYSDIAAVTALVLGILFIITACSTFVSMPDSNSKDALATTPKDSGVIKARLPAASIDHSRTFDKTIDDWEKARATYLRTLDYANIDQQNNAHDEYLLKEKLIESRYHVRNSETAAFTENNYIKSLNELRVAEKYYDKAVHIADHDKLNELKVDKANLDELLKQAKLTVDHGIVFQSLDGYHQVEEKIENLLASR